MSSTAHMPALPADLQHAGWVFLPAESACVHLRDGAHHMVVYTRPYDAVRDPGKRLSIRADGRIHVATWSPGWDAAYAEAIAEMRRIDADRD